MKSVRYLRTSSWKADWDKEETGMSKLGLAGIIYKNGKEVGSYGSSFLSCSYNFQIGNRIHHFWKEDELSQYLQDNGYTVRRGRK